jgi:hypothetical protein
MQVVQCVLSDHRLAEMDSSEKRVQFEESRAFNSCCFSSN